MLRFRPILPKPAPGDAAPSVYNQNGVVSKRRTKRKYVRVRRNSGYARKNKYSSERLGNNVERPCSPVIEEDAAVKTLQLLPEKGEAEQESLGGDSWCKKNVVDLDLNVEETQIMDNREHLSAAEAVGSPVMVISGATATMAVESWVTVESVTSTCMGEGGGVRLGCTDAEKVKNLETDTCPGFISDGNWKVRWVNDAYKKMVVRVSECEKEKRAWPEMVIWLKAKDNSVWRCCYYYRAFTCSVRLQYTWQNEKCSKMVPCDVWRLDFGGFAWRLDVKAALSLGL
ncbi:hypothetical protein RIF29_19559 [Crotalaria pallida]|uniref:DUF7950 domain-containing protein n=1 Tax=Crotalaria pallida TaxID=3830 RepID=A0AAN9F809_CROPI